MYGLTSGLVWPSSAGSSQTLHSVLKPLSSAMTATSIAIPAMNWMTNWPSSVSASAQSPPTVQ